MIGTAWLLSCEHAGNTIRPPWDRYVKIPKITLNSHEGIDIGALEIAQAMQKHLKWPLYIQMETRLLIEVNRSLHHPKLFSRFTKHLTRAQKEELINTIYLPYRKVIEKKIEELLRRSRQVIHLSIHSFTPVLAGVCRQADIGLLYDPSRTQEVHFSHAWRDHLKTAFRTRMNYPYRGTADGFTRHLRKRFPENCYCGIELEVNQKLLQNGTKTVIRHLVKSLEKLRRERYR